MAEEDNIEVHEIAPVPDNETNETLDDDPLKEDGIPETAEEENNQPIPVEPNEPIPTQEVVNIYVE